jgi:hypothetical protein
MPRLPSEPQIIHRKDVPHLSESLLIGIERWRFVEGAINEFGGFRESWVMVDRPRFSALRGEMGVHVPRRAWCRAWRRAIKSAEVLSRNEGGGEAASNI